MKTLDDRAFLRLTAAKRRAYVREAAQALGGEFRQSPAARASGQLLFEHVPSGIEYVLLGGGRVRLGLSVHELRAAHAISEPLPFDADTLRQSAPVKVRPMLISRRPVTAGVIRKLGEGKSLSSLDETSAAGGYPAYVERDAALDITKRLGARLPTEAEWEYACRAGTQTLFVWGDTLLPRKQLAAWLDLERTRGQRANAFGLSTLFAGEWTADEWKPSHRASAKGRRGVQVIKAGGSIFWPWQDAGEWKWCMPAHRMPSTGLFEDRRAAFRVVRPL